MAFQDIIQCLTVAGSLVLLLVVPFLLLAFFLAEKREWPVVFLLAMVLGCSLQAVSGLLWSHIVRGQPFNEVLLFLALCLFMTILVIGFRRRLSDGDVTDVENHNHIILIFILTAAFVVRSIHPLQTFALGQSDAYTHLNYLNYIVKQGYLANVVYPSGYHWLLALPVLVFKVDPYNMARFSGAFFGTGLVLGIYVFLGRLFNHRAAVFGSFCAACFPGMFLLMKTGVGAFANQLGLFLIPALLYCYVSYIKNEKKRGAALVSSVAILGFAASVPMMLIHVFIIIGLERISNLFWERKKWFVRTFRIATFCLPAILLLGFHFSQAGSGQRFQTAQILTNYGERDKAVTEQIVHKVESVGNKLGNSQRKIVNIIAESPYLRLLIDFLSVKRVGFSNVYIDAVAWTLAFLFLLFIAYGMYRRNAGFLVLGLWGGLTTLQASTGYLQFSSYQREGWSLLVATCCLSGILVAILYTFLGKYRPVKIGVSLFIILSFLWTVVSPPSHFAIQSSAEDLLIRTVRFLGKGAVPAGKNSHYGGSFGRLTELLDRPLLVTLVSRKFVGWNNQGELVPNVLPHEAKVKTLLVNAQQSNGSISLTKDSQYVVFIDKAKDIQPAEMTSAFAMVSPKLVKGVLAQQKYLYRANYAILEYINSLDKSEWVINKIVLSCNLIAYVIVPVNSN